MSNIIKKISARAKQIRKAHPNKKWTDCIKQASKDLKGGKLGHAAKKRGTVRKSGAKRSWKTAKKNKYRQTGETNLLADRKRKAKAPGKRTSKKGRVYYERRANRSDVPRTLTGTGTSAYNEMILRRMRDNNFNLALAEKTLIALQEKHKWLKPGGEKKVMASNIKKHKKYIATIKDDNRMLKRLIA